MRAVNVALDVFLRQIELVLGNGSPAAHLSAGQTRFVKGQLGHLGSLLAQANLLGAAVAAVAPDAIGAHKALGPAGGGLARGQGRLARAAHEACRVEKVLAPHAQPLALDGLVASAARLGAHGCSQAPLSARA